MPSEHVRAQEVCDKRYLYSNLLLAHFGLFWCSWLKKVVWFWVFWVFFCGCITEQGLWGKLVPNACIFPLMNLNRRSGLPLRNGRELLAVTLPTLPGATLSPEAPVVAGRGGSPVQVSSSSLRAPFEGVFLRFQPELAPRPPQAPPRTFCCHFLPQSPRGRSTGIRALYAA